MYIAIFYFESPISSKDKIVLNGDSIEECMFKYIDWWSGYSQNPALNGMQAVESCDIVDCENKKHIDNIELFRYISLYNKRME